VITAQVQALIDAAEAVLDSDCGVQALGELAEALFGVDAARDYRAEYPIVTEAVPE